MTLQRINRVLIRDIRSWRGEHVFTFDENITILFGPNGSGKSSVWTGIVLGLLYKISGDLGEKIKPIGGGSSNPYTEIDFTADGVKYRIEKVFAKRSAATARLSNLDSGVLISEGDAAVIDCRNLLTGSEDQEILGIKPKTISKVLEASTKGQIIDLILPMQGQLNQRPEGNEALSSIGLKANAESQNISLNSMIEMVGEAKKELVSNVNKDGIPHASANGELVRKRREHDRIKEEETRLSNLSNDLQTFIREVNELETEMNQEETEVNTQDKIDTLRREADAHQVSREVVEKIVNESYEIVNPLKIQHEERIQLRKQAEILNTQNTQLNGQKVERKENYRGSKNIQDSRSENMESLNKKLDVLNQWITFAQRKDAADSQKHELSVLEADRDLLNDAIDKVAEIQTELNSITLATPEQFERIRHISQEISAIRGAADAWSIMEFSPGKEHRIFIDGEEIEEAPESVNTSIEIRNAKGKAKLRVENTISLSKILELEEELENIFSELSVEGTKELRSRQIIADGLTGKLDVENSRIKDLNKRIPMDERAEKIANLIAILETSVIEPKAESPGEGDWSEKLIILQGERDSAKTLMKESGKALDTTRDKLIEIRAQLKLLNGQINEKNEEITTHVEAFGEDEALQSKLVEEQIKLEQAQDKARPFIENRKANEEQKRNMAQTLQDQITGGYNKRTRIVELQATIKDRRTTGGLGELSNIKVQNERLNRIIIRLENDYFTLQALEKALNTVKKANIEAIRPRVKDTIQNGARYVFGKDVQISLSDDGFPKAIEHIQGRQIPFEQESFGTQEQLNLIYRIALAGIIAEDERHGLCIVLDDPFGDTDAGRRQRMIEWMGAQLGHADHQLILLTCKGHEFNGFGHHDDIRQH